MERSEHKVADVYFSAVASKCGSTFEALLKSTSADKALLARLKGWFPRQCIVCVCSNTPYLPIRGQCEDTQFTDISTQPVESARSICFFRSNFFVFVKSFRKDEESPLT